MKTAADFPIDTNVKFVEVSGAESVGVVTHRYSRYSVYVKWTTGETVIISVGVLEKL